MLRSVREFGGIGKNRLGVIYKGWPSGRPVRVPGGGGQ
jgi:hypothetical protein